MNFTQMSPGNSYRIFHDNSVDFLRCVTVKLRCSNDMVRLTVLDSFSLADVKPGFKSISSQIQATKVDSLDQMRDVAITVVT